ncbi:MAG: bifunctional DNA-formamidopyrimidine glycosylase/DNA-(apurinic or apyrimidinic site) lyase [Rubrivivax sp.]|jgi:formamidopyrimidine-DNA glycosylase|nr:bifunctional DNA-formamidopyrimidine glycosylase/DNA-(apurinic or apyrimidinic site) lyase [Rubrivivax sp.]
MPELPEVEVTRRSIEAPLAGAVVQAVVLGKPLRWPLGCAPGQLAGRAVGPVSRRGKYLWMALGPRPGQGPDDAGGLLLHLGMSGSLGFHALGSTSSPSSPPPPGPHDHFDLVTTQGTLRLHDPRRFGAVVWSASMDLPPAAPLLARLGPEPFDAALTPLSFHARLHTHRTALKNVLLSGQAVVGAGNIYACEALFQAGIDPRMRADRLSRPRAARLLQAVRDTLARATAMGGSTLRDFRDAHGMNGEFQAEAAVYGREGQPCPRCATSIRRIVQGQRATYFCPSCQKR